MDTEVITTQADTDPAQLANQGLLLEEQYHCTGDARTLCAAIGVFQKLLTITPQDDSRLPHYLESWLRNARYLRDLVPAQGDLGETYSICRTVLELIGEVKPIVSQVSEVEASDSQDSERGDNKANHFCSRTEQWITLAIIAEAFHASYRQRKEIEDHDRATAIYWRILDEIPKNIPIFAYFLDHLARALKERYSHDNQTKYLDLSIEVSRQAVQATDEDDSELIPRLERLGCRLRERYERTEDIETLQEIQQLGLQAMRFTPKVDSNMALLLYNSGKAYLLHWAQTEDRDALEKAIIVTRQSVECTPEGDDGLANRLRSLGACAFAMFKHTDRMEDLDNGIDAFRRAAQLVPNNHPTQSNSSALLRNALLVRFQAQGNLQDIDSVLSASREAAAAGAGENDHDAWALYHLGSQLDFKYVNTGDVDCLHEAIQVCSQALDRPGEDHVICAKILALRGQCLRELFEHTGDISELERAITDCKQAAEIMPEDHHALPGILQRLAFSSQEQYQLSGEIKYLEEAIKIAHRSLSLASIYGHEMSKFLSTLGGILLRRYSATLRLRDLDDAIKALRKSLENESQMPKVVTATNLDILASCLGTRYRRSGDQRDLQGAEHASRQAVEIAPASHAGLPAILSNLGRYLMELFQATREPNYLEESMQTFTCALDRVRSPLHAQLCLGVMAGCRRIMYMITHNDEHLEAAIEICRKSIAALPTETDILADCQDELALLLHCQNSDDQEEALGLSLQVWNSLRASPFGRIRAANRAVTIYIEQSNLEKAYALATAAIDVLPLVHNQSLTLQDQQEVVQVFSGLATYAFSLALRTKRSPIEALDLLERGRGVILRLLMNDRSDLFKRRNTQLGLSAEVEIPLYEMHSPTVSLCSGNAANYHFDSQRAQGGSEAPTEDIHCSPTVDSSEKRVTEEEVKEGAARGRVIIVNITSVGSDALVISSTGLKVIHLQGLDPDEARDWIKKDMTATSVNRGANNKAYLRFLSWLWRVCVKPVFDGLQYKVHDSPEDMPRVWWVGTGLASSFPFHAAGNHLTERNESANSRVLSSYTPSLRALLYTRNREPLSDQATQCPKLLTVSMATTPGADDLDGVLAEIVAVTDTIGNYVHAECLSQPDADTVKRRLADCHIAHFACHGVSEPRDPSQSGLLLQTIGDSPEQDRLTVGSLYEIDCSQGQIAYLSACSTAENRSKWLVDEVLHVVSGFQVAGFRNVIGCLWPADDTVCAEVAKPFYSELCRGGKMEYNDGTVSLALHKAVLQISRSSQYRKRPLHWAQYVHFGA